MDDLLTIAYLEKMVRGLSGDRGQTETDLRRLISMLKGEIEPGSPGFKPVPPPRPPMSATAATPGYEPPAPTPAPPAPEPEPEPEPETETAPETDPEPDPVPSWEPEEADPTDIPKD